MSQITNRDLFNDAKETFQAISQIESLSIAEPHIERILTKWLQIMVKVRRLDVKTITNDVFDNLKTEILLTIKQAYLEVIRGGATRGVATRGGATPPSTPHLENGETTLTNPILETVGPISNVDNDNHLTSKISVTSSLLNHEHDVLSGEGNMAISDGDDEGNRVISVTSVRGGLRGSGAPPVLSLSLSESEINAISQQFQTQFKRAFWDKIREDLKASPINLSQFMILVKEIRDRINNLTPNNLKFQANLTENVDLGIITNILSNLGLRLDLLKPVVDYIIEERLRQLIAPQDDIEFDQWTKELDLVVNSVEPKEEIVVKIFQGIYTWIEKIEKGLDDFRLSRKK